MKFRLLPSLTVTCLLLNHNHVMAETINQDKYVDYNSGTGTTMEGITTVGSKDNYGKLTVATEQGGWTTGLFQVGMNGGSGEVNIINGGKLVVKNDFGYAYPFGIGASDDSRGEGESLNSESESIRVC